MRKIETYFWKIEKLDELYSYYKITAIKKKGFRLQVHLEDVDHTNKKVMLLILIWWEIEIYLDDCIDIWEIAMNR